MAQQLRRFWIRFENDRYSAFGYGVTAWTEGDALTLLCNAVGLEAATLTDLTIETDVDVSTLDQRHVIPNMDSPNWRGVWFPRGYAR